MAAVGFLNAQAGTVAAAQPSISDETLGRLMESLTVADHGVTEEFIRATNATRNVFRNMKETIQQQAKEIASLKAMILGLQGQLQESEKVRKGEMAALAGRMDGIEKNFKAQFVALKAQDTAIEDRSTQGIAEVKRSISSLNTSFSSFVRDHDASAAAAETERQHREFMEDQYHRTDG